MARTKHESLTIFFPFYQDAGTVKKMISDAYHFGRQLADDLEVIAVNDGSRDGTLKELNKMKKEFPHLIIINHKRNKGYGGALISGIKNSTKDWVFYTDGDAQYHLDELEKLWNRRVGYDVVNGYKLYRNDSFARRFLGSVYRNLTRFFFKFPIRDIDCDFRFMNGKLLRSLDISFESGAITVELIEKFALRKAKFKEIGVHHYERVYGRSTFFTPRRVFRKMGDEVKLFISLRQNSFVIKMARKFCTIFQNHDLRYVAALFFITRIAVIIFGAMGYHILFEQEKILKPMEIGDFFKFEEVWDRWDSKWYIRLAKEGYPQHEFSAEKETTWGFMPLYPLLIRTGSHIFNSNFFLIGTVISNISSFLAVFFIYKLASERFGVGRKVILALLLSAGSYFLSIVYTEGLFLLLVSLVFYLSYKKKFILSALFAGLASVTRTQGILLLLIPFLELILKRELLERKIIKVIVSMLIGITPMLIFTTYLYITCGEPFAFLESQKVWGTVVFIPFQPFARFLVGKAYLMDYINTFFWIINIVIFALNIKKMPFSYIVFSSLYFLSCIGNEAVYGATRYLLVLIPAFLAVSFAKRNVYIAYLLINVMFLSFAIISFMNSTLIFQ